jgi:hypothetical protein
MQCAISGRAYERAGKHTAYDSIELNRRWTLLWELHRGGLPQLQRCLGENR